MKSSEITRALRHNHMTSSHSHMTSSSSHTVSRSGHMTGRISGKRVNSNGFFRWWHNLQLKTDSFSVKRSHWSTQLPSVHRWVGGRLRKLVCIVPWNKLCSPLLLHVVSHYLLCPVSPRSPFRPFWPIFRSAYYVIILIVGCFFTNYITQQDKT